jgi:hypothetical protein
MKINKVIFNGIYYGVFSGMKEVLVETFDCYYDGLEYYDFFLLVIKILGLLFYHLNIYMV